MKTEVENNGIRLLIEREIYSEEVLHKCFYWYGANFIVEIATHSADFFEVKLQRTNLLLDLEATVDRVKRDLVDFKLRDIVASETKTVRELLVAKAFANYGINDDPTTEISDPVGFNPYI
jgi:His-Xaa-Ser system protein HxsD